MAILHDDADCKQSLQDVLLCSQGMLGCHSTTSGPWTRPSYRRATAMSLWWRTTCCSAQTSCTSLRRLQCYWRRTPACGASPPGMTTASRPLTGTLCAWYHSLLCLAAPRLSKIPTSCSRHAFCHGTPLKPGAPCYDLDAMGTVSDVDRRFWQTLLIRCCI